MEVTYLIFPKRKEIRRSNPCWYSAANLPGGIKVSISPPNTSALRPGGERTARLWLCAFHARRHLLHSQGQGSSPRLEARLFRSLPPGTQNPLLSEAIASLELGSSGYLFR